MEKSGFYYFSHWPVRKVPCAPQLEMSCGRFFINNKEHIREGVTGCSLAPLRILKKIMDPNEIYGYGYKMPTWEKVFLASAVVFTLLSFVGNYILGLYI